MDTNKSEIPQEADKSYVGYDKMFIQLIGVLNKCDSQKELDYFTSSFIDTFIKDAPEQLVDYLKASIKNKMISFAKRENINLIRLRAISRL